MCCAAGSILGRLDILLPAKHRLTASREFHIIFSRGRSVADSLLVLYVLRGPDAAPRFGFSVGRKLGGAVQRNRVKRVLREAVRLLLPEIAAGNDYVIVARKRAADISVDEALNSLKRLSEKLGARTRTEH